MMKARYSTTSNPFTRQPSRGVLLSCQNRNRRAFILPVMLMVLLLMGLLVASFSFQMHADRMALTTISHRLQAREAALSGIEYAKLLLRDHRFDRNKWYNNYEELHRVLVWKDELEAQEFGKTENVDTTDSSSPVPAWRFSLVADDPTDDEEFVRYGITGEASKIDINTANVETLTTLLNQLCDENTPVDELVGALIDWRDADNEISSNGAESEYYMTLEVPYSPKNAPFDTVEELLMVKGFTAQILYGEDYDRNGLMSENENDGEASFPYDDGDGTLDLGLYPYLTVYSMDYNNSNANKPRVNILSGDADQIRTGLEEDFTEEEINYILSAIAVKGDQKLDSVVDLLEPHMANDMAVNPPFLPEEQGKVFDLLTTSPNPVTYGLIDVNSAPAEVLRCIPNLPETGVHEMIKLRSQLDSEAKTTPVWLLSAQSIDSTTLELILPYITTRSRYFTVESMGYADHEGIMIRLQAIIEMRGPLAQVVYQRDLSRLGFYPVRLEDMEGVEVNAQQDAG